MSTLQMLPAAILRVCSIELLQQARHALHACRGQRFLIIIITSSDITMTVRSSLDTHNRRWQAQIDAVQNSRAMQQLLSNDHIKATSTPSQLHDAF